MTCVHSSTKFRVPRGYILLGYLEVKHSFNCVNIWESIIIKRSKKKPGYIVMFVKKYELNKYLSSLSNNPNATS